MYLIQPLAFGKQASLLSDQWLNIECLSKKLFQQELKFTANKLTFDEIWSTTLEIHLNSKGSVHLHSLHTVPSWTWTYFSSDQLELFITINYARAR